jgi:3-hydroxyacyl-[acyl-carrier-protein] dehydratase
MHSEDSNKKQEINGSEQEILSGTFFFDPDDPIYTEHFPGNPVVPGSMIIHAFMLVAGKRGLNQGATSIDNFRFKRFVSPGEYPYRVEIAGKNLRCSLLDRDSQAVATGILRL